MKNNIQRRNHTDFVNKSIKQEMNRELEKQERQKTLQSLGELRKKRQSMPKSSMKSEDVVRELRAEMIN